jgi:hypothetical protein
MADHDVGYGRPPKRSQFKPGVSGNPSGRRKRQPTALAEIIGKALDAPIEYRERGRIKVTTRRELRLRTLVDRAVKGDLGAAELILKIRAQARRDGEIGLDRLDISDWQPDWPGQTAEQKTLEVAKTGDADPLEWWNQPGQQTKKADV